MSGIFGVYYLDGQPACSSDLAAMRRSLSHRGPDGQGLWSAGAVALGHQMLWTTPESLHEKLPLYNSANGTVVTSDARLDNRSELIALLSFSGRAPESISDGELILAAYDKWGERSVEHLIGDFAFVIWDGRQQILFNARDHSGVKPFYYYWSEKLYAFASEIKSLLCLPEVPRRLNEEKVADYLAETFEDRSSTFYQGILRLPAGHSLTVSVQGARRQCYWSLDPSREIRLSSDNEYAEAFRETLTEAVRCRLRSYKRVGLSLSGGLDSASIACVARNLLTQSGSGLPTFSVIFDETPESDERRYIDLIVDQQGFEPHYLVGDRLGPFSYLERVLRQKYEPPMVQNLFLQWEVREAAKQQGVGVMLDGIDGDATVSHGYGYLGELGHDRRWVALVSELRALNKRLGTSQLRSMRIYGRRYALRPLLSKSQTFRGAYLVGRYASRFLGKRIKENGTPAWCSNLNREFVSRLNLVERRREGRGLAASAARRERDWHYSVVTQGSHANILEESADTAAALSMEPRHPFWDKRLVEFCLALPPEQKLHHGWSRLVMRRAMSGLLPPKVQWRARKTNFAPAQARALRVTDRRCLEKLLQEKPGVEQQYVDLRGLRVTYERFVKDDSGIAPLEMFALTNAVSLIVWLRLFWPEV